MKRKRRSDGAVARLRYPFLVAHPVPLSLHRPDLEALEGSHWFTNFGPESRRFETAFVRALFGGHGHCTTVANATLGLMLSIRATVEQAFGARERRRRTVAIVPSFTFPATAHAALWNGMSVAYCDIDPRTWLPSHESVQRLVDRLGARAGVIVPYATFGNNLDLGWYESLRQKTGIPVVVDAAASVGSRTADGRHFGQGSPLPVVFSMHATKLLATSEGGVVYCGDAEVVRSIRSMTNFGFDEQRQVVRPGINAKLPELNALQGRLKLRDLRRLILRRNSMAARYRRALPELTFQQAEGNPIFVFLAARLAGSAADRDRLIARCLTEGLELRKYYSPPLHRHAYFSRAAARDVAVTDQVADQIVTLPLYDSLTNADIDAICSIIREALSANRRR
jgi:dTDP-4-amino-4,6-dideoxygalactose transaminase